MESNHETEKPSLLNRGKGLLKDLTVSFNSLLKKDELKRKPNYAQQHENINIKQQQQDCPLQLKSADSQSLDSSTASQSSLDQSKSTFPPLQAKWSQSALESRKSSMIHSYAAERAAPIQHAAHTQPNLHSSRSTTHSASQSTAPTSAVQTPQQSVACSPSIHSPQQQQSPKQSIAVLNSSSRQFELGGDSAPLNSSAAGCLDAARRRMSANDALQNKSAHSQHNMEPSDRMSEQRLYTPQFDNRRLLQTAASQMNQANDRQEQIKSDSPQSAIHHALVRHVVVNEAIPNASEFNLAGLGSPKNTTNTLLAHIYEKRSDFPTELDPSLDPREPTPVPLPFNHPLNKNINQLILQHEQRTGGYKAQIQD